MMDNIDDSNYRDVDSLNRSIDTQASFLKKKLIETHNKLLRELELNKELENKLVLLNGKYEHLKLENETLNRKLGQAAYQERNRDREERQVLIEKRNNEIESKNQLLRIDLESMRNKVLSEMLEKSQLEESLRQKQARILELEEEIKECLTQIKKKQAELVNADRNAMALKQKNESAVQMMRKITMQLEERRKIQTNLNLKIVEYETQTKVDKERITNITQQCKNCQRQLQLVRNKLENTENVIADLKNKLYIQSKQRPVVNNSALEKMTQQFNSLNVRYKQLERDLEEARTVPVTENNRKRRDFVQARDFVQRLENEQKQRISQRKMANFSESPPKSLNNYMIPQAPSPTRQYTEKSQYMDIISEIGVLENTLLQCNINKNKILNEIDKIDGTKVKTNELINRRRRLQDDLKRCQQLAEQTKRKLKNLNVI